MTLPNLPKFEMIIDPSVTSDVEVQRVAFVDKPAIEKNFLAFNAIKLDFAIQAERHIVSGPAMIPDMLIYRSDEMGEYNVFFSKETISAIALKFFKKDYHKNLNLFHDPTLSLDNVTIFESFQSDKARGIAPMKGFEDLPDGTWFISAKIEEPKIWEMVTAGTIKGFSVEGIFSYVKKQAASATELFEGLSRTLSAINHITIENTTKNSLMATTILEQLKTFKQKFLTEPALAAPPAAPLAPAASLPLAKDYALKDGTTMVNITDLKVGGMATTAGAPCAPGEYELQDGTKISVGEGGVITAVTPGGAAAPPQFAKEFADITTKLTSYEQRFTTFDATMGEIKVALKKSDDTMRAMAAIVEELAKLPTATPAAAPTVSAFNVDEPTERIKGLAAAFKKLRTA